ncbi:hypothetical protein SAMN02910317_03127 [Ruminococcaceae bacterium FB2012]|nr:hypothetical protein SAMN02910317_03127 [Ruminococcaceae bacterium FB2012]
MAWPKQYTIKTVNPQEMTETTLFLDQITEEYNKISKEDDLEDFRNIGTDLKKLRDISNRLSAEKEDLTLRELKEYWDQADLVRNRLNVVAYNHHTGKYDDKETAEVWKGFVDKASPLITGNISQISDIANKISKAEAKKIFGDTFDLLEKYDPLKMENLHVFYGDKYLSSESRQNSRYSLGRTAGLSATMIILASRGHSLDEIMDPEKLQDEKRSVFSEVAEHMIRGGKEDQEWIAKNLYEGITAAQKLVDDEVAKLDLTTENMSNSERYAQLVFFSTRIHDAWQETKHCDKEIEAYANSKNDIRTYEEIKDGFSAGMGAFTYVANSCINAYHFSQTMLIGGKVDQNDFPRLLAELSNIDHFTGIINDGKKNKDFRNSTSFGRDEVTAASRHLQTSLTAYMKSIPCLENLSWEKQLMTAKFLVRPEVRRMMTVEEPENGKPVLRGIPTDIQIDAGVEMSATDKHSEKLAAVRKQTTKATKAVWHSSSEFDKACEAMQELEESYAKYERTAAAADPDERRRQIRNLQEQAREAEYRVNKYFMRKEKQAKEGKVFDNRTTDRINIMKTAMQEIKDCKADADRKSVANEHGLKQFAARQASAAMEKLEELLDTKYPLGTEARLAAADQKQVRRYIAVIIAADNIKMMNDPAAVIKGDDNAKKFTSAASEVYNDSGLILTCNDMSNKDVSKFLRNRREFFAKMTYNRNLAGDVRKKAPEANAAGNDGLRQLQGGMKK